MNSRQLRQSWAVIVSVACLLAATGRARAADEKAREEAAFKIAVDAYVYAYPLVLMDVTRRRLTNVSVPAGMSAPVNRFANVISIPRPEDRLAISPNADTLYSVAWLDLSQEPIVLHLPDMAGRYYLVPILDAWTNVFVSLGKRTTGTKEGDFAVVGPNWKGKLPAGVKEIKAPTNNAWILGRIQVGGKSDTYRVNALQRQFKLTPLSAFGTSYTPPQKAPVDPKVDVKTPSAKQVENMDMVTFFEMFAKLMTDSPPAPADKKTVAAFETIGIVPGQPFDASKLDAATKKALERGVKAGVKKIRTPSAKIARKYENGWIVRRTGIGTYGTDYQNRAFAAQLGIGDNLPEDAIHTLTRIDGKGKQLTGARRYTIHFAKGQTPPVNAFWSLTLYDHEGFQVANSLNRFAVSSWMPFKYNPDGSLDLYFQNESPGADKEANWLPAPKGPFNLTMRLYGPKSEALTGGWNPPSITAIRP